MNKEHYFMGKSVEELARADYEIIFDKSYDLIDETNLLKKLGIEIDSKEENYFILSMAWNIGRKEKIFNDENNDIDFLRKTAFMDFLETHSRFSKWFTRQVNSLFKIREMATTLLLEEKEKILDEKILDPTIARVLDRVSNYLSSIYLDKQRETDLEDVFTKSEMIPRFKTELVEARVNNRINLD